MIFGGLGARRQMDNPIFSGIPLPGPISGYGGGTFNMDGTVATPSVQTLTDDGQAAPAASQGLLAAAARQMRPRGIFGAPVPVSSEVLTEAQRPGSAAPTPPRPSFDYNSAMASMLPLKPQGSKFLRTVGNIAQVLGPALMAAGGDSAGANALIANLQARRAEDSRRRFETARTLANWQHEDWARQNAADLTASQPFTLGRTRYQFDPQTRQTALLQREPADFQQYATDMGYEPGSPEYMQAAQDYILRGNGPTAVGLDMSLDDHRTDNRKSLENLRQGNRMAYQAAGISGRVAVKTAPTYRDTHPLPQRAPAGRAAGGAPTATGPNGQKIMWNGSAWVPAK